MRQHFVFISILILLVLLVALMNFTPGTWLSGWDTIHPEFNFSLNITRSLAGVWQEYQGLGLVGGMSFIAGLPHYVLLWILSIFLPISILRYVWTFMILCVGVLGAYFLSHLNLKKHYQNESFLINLAACGAGIFYLFNLNTVQTFTAPFEAFVGHYAALPWLLFGAQRLLELPSRKNIILYTILNLVLLSYAYIPTLFLVSVLDMGIICFFSITRYRLAETIKRSALILGITLVTNMFWLLPFLYFTYSNSSVVVNSKINQMATESIYLRNKEFGTVWDTLTLKNFWFNTYEYNPKTSSHERILVSWLPITNGLVFNITEMLILSVLVIGLFKILWSKKQLYWVVIIFISFMFIANDTFPFSWIIDTLRTKIPLLSQFFRFPFTKWGMTLALNYSVIWSFGISSVLHSKFLHKKFKTVIIGILLFIPVMVTYPLAQGHLISATMRNIIPQDYRDVFTYFQHQLNGRIAYLPNSSFWDWRYYKWGYVGSGFLWYGLKQPIMDNAFNSWSKYNENYYWELSHALYSKKPVEVENVLDKYDITYIILDNYITSSDSNRALFIPETIDILASIPSVSLITQIGNLSVYERIEPNIEDFISIKQNLPTVSPSYSWSEYDAAFNMIKDYLAGDTNKLNANSKNLVYPYRSLFTKRSVTERDFNVAQSGDGIKISSIIQPSVNFKLDESVDLVYDTQSDASEPLVKLNYEICSVIPGGSTNLSIQKGFIKTWPQFTATTQRGCASVNLPTLSHKLGYLVAVDSNHSSGRPLVFAINNSTSEHIELDTFLPLETDWTTSYFILPPLSDDGLGYMVYFGNEAIGRQTTVNELKRIRFFKIPYDELVQRVQGEPTDQTIEISENDFSVTHPNSAYYEIKTNTNFINDQTTIIQSQAYDKGWMAYVVQPNWLAKTFPFFFGTELKDHVLVNNWANGWNLDSETVSGKDLTIVIFFLPQLLQWLGFALLPLPFLYAWRMKRA